MKDSLFIISFFVCGLLLGIIFQESLDFDISRFTDYALYSLLLFVGVNLGSDPKFMDIIRSIHPRIFLLPLSTIIGTLLGVIVYHLIFGKLEFGESLAVGFGFGYYSLSNIILTKLSPIASGGATSMDTTLPIIIKSSGKEYLIHSMMHGVILTILVPFLVSLAIQFF